jgi:ATP-dependent Lhr-like helicase
LRDLFGAEELRELLDADVLAGLELELQRLVDGRRARDADELHDTLRTLGPLDRLGLDARSIDGVAVDRWLQQLREEGRIIDVRVADPECVTAADDAARLRDAVGVALPVGLPAVYTDPVEDPLGDLCRRYARTQGPFVTRDVATGLECPKTESVLLWVA